MSRITPLAVLLLSSLGAAEEPAPTPPPQVTEPPPWIPYQAVNGPSPAELRALEDGGLARQSTGGILLAAGGAVALIGTVLWIAGSWDCDDWSHHHQNDGCGSSGLSIVGGTTWGAGAALLITGIVLHASGSRDVDQARAMKSCLWGPISLEPKVSPSGASLSLKAELF